jgi:Bacitracin resistance protein BacA
MHFLKNRRRELNSADHAARQFAHWYRAMFGAHLAPSTERGESALVRGRGTGGRLRCGNHRDFIVSNGTDRMRASLVLRLGDSASGHSQMPCVRGRSGHCAQRAAMLAGLTFRPAATEFAFLVGIPTIFAATAYELLKVRHEAGQEDWNARAIGFVVSGIVAVIAVRWLLHYIQSHRFTIFAWYRIVLGGALLAMAHQGIVYWVYRAEVAGRGRKLRARAKR